MDIVSGVLVGARYQVVRSGVGTRWARSGCDLRQDPPPSLTVAVAWELYWSSSICFCGGVLRTHKGAPAFHASTFIFGAPSIEQVTLFRAAKQLLPLD